MTFNFPVKRISVFLSLLFFLACGLSGIAWGTDDPGSADVPAVPVASPDAATDQALEKSDTVSLDFKEADINTVLRVLSMKSGMNIISGPEVKGLVTVRLDNVPWDKALSVILRTYDYVFERDGNIIRVTTREKMTMEPVETKTFILNYSKANEIHTAIQDILSERGRIKTSERTNMVVVTDIPTNLYKIGKVIEELDKVTPQAYIDSKIIKTDVSNTDKLGIDWNVVGGITSGVTRPTTFPFTSTSETLPASVNQFFPVLSGSTSGGGGATEDYIVSPVNPRDLPYVAKVSGNTPSLQYGTLSFSDFAAVLSLIETRTNSKAISNPRIVVLNNMTARVKVGEEVPIPSFERNETTGSMEVTGFSYRDTGVVLNVTPHINSAEEILVDLSPEVSQVGDNQKFGTGQIEAPKFTTTQAKTQVLIQSGQTIAIGGLMSDKTGITENKVPFFGDIPLIGKLFRSQNPSNDANPSTQKVETLFFVTVTMVDSQGQPVSAKDADQKQNTGTQQAATVLDKQAGSSGTATAVEAVKAGQPQ
jgi:type IV pilus assembly protein PilQ